MMSAEALDTIIIGVASLAIAGMSFVYASRAQAATRATAAQARTAAGVVSDAATAAAGILDRAAPVDATAYARARELYESAISGLREEITRLSAENTELRHRIGLLEEKIRRLAAPE